ALGAHRESKGHKTPIHIDSTSFVDSSGERTQCRSVLIDLSELRSAEEARRTWEARDKTLLDTAADAIVSSDVTGRIVSFNKAPGRLFGYKEAEVLGKNVQMLMPSPYRDEHDRYIRRYVSTGEARIIGQPNREVIALRKDGTTFPIELGIGEWHDRGERRFTAIIHDISERKRAEEDVRRSEHRFRQIADHLEDVLAIIDRDGKRISYASRAFERIWGRPISDLYSSGAAWPDSVHQDDRDRVQVAHENYVKGDPLDEEYRILRSDGE